MALSSLERSTPTPHQKLLIRIRRHSDALADHCTYSGPSDANVPTIRIPCGFTVRAASATPRSMRLGLAALDASVDLTCGAADGYGVTTPNVKNRTLVRRETGRESRVQVPDALAAALWTNYFFAAAIDLPLASVDLSWAAVDDAWACSDCLRASS